MGTRSGLSEQILRDLLAEVSHNNSSLTLWRFAAESEPGIFSSGKVPGFVYLRTLAAILFTLRTHQIIIMNQMAGVNRIILNKNRLFLRLSKIQ